MELFSAFRQTSQKIFEVQKHPLGGDIPEYTKGEV
jgi:hypothetical protein